MNYGLIIFTMIIFSTLEVTGKMIGTSISPYVITVFRFLIGGLFLLPFALAYKKKKKIKLAARDILRLTLPGIINVCISMLFLQLAVYYGEAAISAILISANSIFVAIFSHLILKEKISLFKIIGLVLGLTGITMIILNQPHNSADAINPALGIFYGCSASITFGLFTVVSKKYIKEYGNLITNSISFINGSLILLILSLLFHRDFNFVLTTKNLLFMLYLGIFISGIGYLTYFEGLKKVSATIGSMFFFLKPIIASVLAYLVFGEKLSSIQILGIFVIITGLNLDLFRQKTIKHRLIVRSNHLAKSNQLK